MRVVTGKAFTVSAPAPRQQFADEYIIHVYFEPEYSHPVLNLSSSSIFVRTDTGCGSQGFFCRIDCVVVLIPLIEYLSQSMMNHCYCLPVDPLRCNSYSAVEPASPRRIRSGRCHFQDSLSLLLDTIKLRLHKFHLC